MTQQAMDVFGTAFKNGTATLMARILGNSGVPIVPTDVSAIACSVYILDDQEADARNVVPGHDAIPLAVDAVIQDALQSGPPWDALADAAGYNFCHTPDVSANPAFPVAGRRCLVEYRLTPVAGQVILVRFRINVI